MLLALLISGAMNAQSDEMIAYVPSKAPTRTADNTKITFLDPVVPGVMELSLPEGTRRVDLLNARGKVKATHEGPTMQQIDLRKLRRGTWTLRAHTPDGMMVRRFLVLGHGQVVWQLPPAPRRR
jgi:hypothetical protein